LNPQIYAQRQEEKKNRMVEVIKNKEAALQERNKKMKE
jgi:hypothetical protein